LLFRDDGVSRPDSPSWNYFVAMLAFTVHRGTRQREGTVTGSFDDSLNDVKSSAQTVEQRARELLSEHPHFRGRAGDFEYEYREDVLIVRGRVPTFYLKQILQTVLKDVEGVACIENLVDITSSSGVSSVRGSTSLPTD
jgi:hypothetical protein